ncbi:MAG: septum formation inhibitor Maf [Sandaracinus sp.]|nr:septum formation inhibitor Maf [Sandaracinus sp.]
MASAPDSERLVLASASPRRRELLGLVTLPAAELEILPADIDESERPGEEPAEYVRRMARSKAEAVARQRPESWVLAADTIVALGDAVLAKPADAPENAAMIARLAGRPHQVTTAVALARGEVREVLAITTEVRFRPLTASEVEEYAATGEGLDKAGGYGIQGRGAALVEGITGSYTNVVGLPLAETLLLLRRWLGAAGEGA